MPRGLEGKYALITGAAYGLGKAAAEQMVKLGVNVALLDFEEAVLKEVVSALQKLNPKVRVVTLIADLKSDEQIKSAVERCMMSFERLDILVNAAGIVRPGSIETQTMAEYDETLQVNARGMFLMIKICVPHLEKTKGVVVNVASVGTAKVLPGMVSYLMSKGAVDMLTKAVALELSGKGIRVNAVKPGTIKTNILISGGWNPKAAAEFYETAGEQYPVGRIGLPEEIADAICFLASDEASFITGELLLVDGGFAAGHIWSQEKQ